MKCHNRQRRVQLSNSTGRRGCLQQLLTCLCAGIDNDDDGVGVMKTYLIRTIICYHYYLIFVGTIKYHLF